MSTIKVEYVGRKPFAIDNVARSGVMWNGAGDVQLVTPAQAKILTAYADQWALVDGDDQTLLDAPVVVVVQDKDGTDVTIAAESLSKPIEKMSATELAAYAKQKHNVTLARNKGRTALLNEVISLENGATSV